MITYTKDILKDEYDKVGNYTYGVPTVLRSYPECRLTIGKFCSIGNNVTFAFWGRHAIEDITTYPFQYLSRWSSTQGSVIEKEDIYVGNDVWIANNVLILQGANIGDGAVLGANCTVAGEVKPYTVVVGNPAKPIRIRFTDHEIEMLSEMRWWDWEEDDIKRCLPIICSPNVYALYDIWRKNENTR